jgi:UDP-GlcNAc:undecaprenyl-phosphate/decaprenyl-phosphate GlcNAc-1-phosphate transferase
VAWPTRENYRGKVIPTAMGVIFVFAAALFIPLLANMADNGFSSITDFSFIGNRVWAGLYALIAVVGTLGFLDDVLGSSEARGFKGHVGALLRGRVTTGLIKAIGGGLAALVVGWWVPVNPTATEVIVNALVVALSINVLNLLDLRPGRALKAYFFCFALLAAWGLYTRNPVVWPYSVPVIAIAIGLYSGDQREQFMLGDTGSNILGASIGFIMMVMAGPLVKLVIAAVLIAMNLASERWSFSKIIESTTFLKRLDDAGRHF